MLEIFKLFLGVLNARQRKLFAVYIILLFVGSISSIFGIGAVIPFISVLLEPDRLQNYSFLNGYSYHFIVLCLALGLIVAFWVKNLIAAILLCYQVRFLNSITMNVQNKLFRKYILMDYSHHLNRSTPALIRNISVETSQFSTGIVNPLGVLITDIFSTFFIVIALFSLSIVFSGVIITSLAVFVLSFVFYIRKKNAKFGLLRSSTWEEMNKITLNSLNGIKEVKLYQKESVFINAFNHGSYQLKNATVFNNFYQQIPRMFIEVVSISMVLVMLVVFIYSGVSTVDLFVLLSVFGVASAQLLPALNRIMASLTNIKYSKQALVTIHKELFNYCDKVLDDVNSIEVKKASFTRSIMLKKIFYSYSNGTKALNNVNVEIKKGLKTAFVGSSGAGKSTLVDLILGFYEPQSGQVVLDGKILRTKKEKLSFQKLFAYIPQQIILYDCSVRENIAFAVDDCDIDDDLVWKCLKMAQLEEFVKELSQGMHTFVGENGIRLSGGQRQRLGIARALYQRPDILVMDEATSALDNETEKEITEVIKNLKDITIITISHRLSTIEGYDRIYKLNKGSVVS
ncbi:ABC transporter ATP-binding protein [Francisella halioticida]|uniref:ABC transporter ATP-binding protein n=1 Tax=Francisella halioticida TaxID=549298 RepID=A0ABN5AX93_9GAMM|nr:ABC transporter ATP-binding protein [Francisella halioticida]ASG68533.1 ABC transporter ATP-binding protein [Francisella halioticida]